MEHDENTLTYESKYPAGIMEGLEGEYYIARSSTRGIFKYINMHVKPDIYKLGDSSITSLERPEARGIRDFLTRVRLEVHVCHKSFLCLLESVDITDLESLNRVANISLHADNIAVLLTTLREFFCPPRERTLTSKSYFYQLAEKGREKFNRLQTRDDRLRCIETLENALNSLVSDMQVIVMEMGGDVPNLFSE